MSERQFTVWIAMRTMDPDNFIPQLLIMNHLGTLKRITLEEMDDYAAKYYNGPYNSSEASIEKLNPITLGEISNRKLIVECFNNCGKIVVENDIKGSHAYLRKEQVKYNLASQSLSPFIVEIV